MKHIILVPLLFVIFVLHGCSPISVKTDYDRRVDFNEYVTYKWMPYPAKGSKQRVPKGSFLDVRIRRAVENELLNNCLAGVRRIIRGIHVLSPTAGKPAR